MVEHHDLLWRAISRTQEVRPFELLAWVIMPDHFHLLLSTERGDFSDLMKRIKLSFAASFRQRMGLTRGTIWEARYWDYVIRNEEDLRRHFDYIHFNAVKHGRVADPFEWKESSIHRWLKDSDCSSLVSSLRDEDGQFGE